MEDRGIVDFLRREGRALLSIALAVLGVAVMAVGISRGGTLPPLSYGDVGGLIVAFVAVSSLYIAWRELVRKTQPNVTIDFSTEYPDLDGIQERMLLKLTNSGANVITPINAWYGLVRKDGASYYLTNEDMCVFDDDGLSPGETAEAQIGEDIVLAQLKNVNIRDWTGSGVSLDKFGRDRRQIRTHLVESHGDAEVRLQKLFDVLMERDIHQGIRVPYEELQSHSLDELIEEYGLDREGIITRRAA